MADDQYLLDFEKPLYELERKLAEMRELNKNNAEDLSNEIKALDERVERLRASIYRNLTRWQRVQIARHPQRPYTLDHIEALTDGFVELHGDRKESDDRAIVGGLATFQGSRFGGSDRTVMIMGHQKGRDTKERKYRRFGMPNPEGYRKAERLMKLAAKFNKPVVTLLDTPGAYPGLEAEKRGQAEAIARNLMEMSRLPVPIVVVIIGEGRCPGYRRGRPRADARKRLVLCHRPGELLADPVALVGLQRGRRPRPEAYGHRPGRGRRDRRDRGGARRRRPPQPGRHLPERGTGHRLGPRHAN